MDLLDDYDSSDNEFSLYDHSRDYSFEEFKKQNPSYLENLNNRIKLLYNTYDAMDRKRYAKLGENREQNEIACWIGMGMLMRHALEVVSIDVALKNGIEVGGKSVHERLSAMQGQVLSGYSKEKEVVLFKTLDLTNKIAHPHVTSKEKLSYHDFRKFYHDSFKGMIESHILHTDRRDVKKYLSALKQRMDDFNIGDKITRALILGCFIRQLTECTVNLWCYNYQLPPTDISTAENPLSLSRVLITLSYIARQRKKTAFGSSAMTTEVVDTLYRLKNASNNLMHVTPESIKIRCIEKYGKDLKELHASVMCECSPDALEMKFDKTKQEKTTLITTLLCGFFGWFGVHHFYGGNIGKGVAFLLFGGFLIGPIVSLSGIYNGNFHTKKWGALIKTKWTSFLSSVFIILHLIFLWFIFFGK